jgi:uncharacterized surface protein with fasciclin (FAS1) repeats
MCRLLRKYNLIDDLKKESTLTLFAPTDGAFNIYYNITGKDLYSVPKNVIEYHAYSEKIYYFNGLACNETIVSIQGDSSITECTDVLTKYQIGTGQGNNNKPLIEEHSIISNGIILKVNNVIVPAPPTTPESTLLPTLKTLDPTQVPVPQLSPKSTEPTSSTSSEPTSSTSKIDEMAIEESLSKLTSLPSLSDEMTIEEFLMKPEYSMTDYFLHLCNPYSDLSLDEITFLAPDNEAWLNTFERTDQDDLIAQMFDGAQDCDKKISALNDYSLSEVLKLHMIKESLRRSNLFCGSDIETALIRQNTTTVCIPCPAHIESLDGEQCKEQRGWGNTVQIPLLANQVGVINGYIQEVTKYVILPGDVPNAADRTNWPTDPPSLFFIDETDTPTNTATETLTTSEPSPSPSSEPFVVTDSPTTLEPTNKSTTSEPSPAPTVTSTSVATTFDPSPSPTNFPSTEEPSSSTVTDTEQPTLTPDSQTSFPSV